MHDSKNQPILNSAVYDKLKVLAQIVLPALGTLYFALSEIWGLPNGAEIVGTIVAIDAFFGVILGISSAQYNNSEAKYDGTATVSPSGKVNLNADPSDFYEKPELLLKVEQTQEVT